jgi:hypothetical protein
MGHGGFLLVHEKKQILRCAQDDKSGSEMAKQRAVLFAQPFVCCSHFYCLLRSAAATAAGAASAGSTWAAPATAATTTSATGTA